MTNEELMDIIVAKVKDNKLFTLFKLVLGVIIAALILFSAFKLLSLMMSWVFAGVIIIIVFVYWLVEYVID